MKRIDIVALVSLSLFLTACCASKLAVKPLKDFVIDAAQAAKEANAEKIELELHVTVGRKVGATVPISVVAIGAEGVVQESSKVKITIEKLQAWQRPQGSTETYFLDPASKLLMPIK